MSSNLRTLPRPVWLLGWASLFTDAATEAIYPLLPFFLTRVLHAGPVSLGLIEGAAEAANSVLKILAGGLSDRWRVRRPIVLIGYSISSAVRPLMALARAWPQVLAIRFADRIGKGIRGAPRDAMLAAWADRDSRGLVFGFHRAMDHAGAVVGPLAATLFLIVYPERYRTLFALTIVPGAIAVLMLLGVPEDGRATGAPGPAAGTPGGDPPGDGRRGWAALPGGFYRYLSVLLLFTLGNSSDAFLLLRLTDAAGGVRFIPILWALLHVVKSTSSVVGGRLSDRGGRRAVIGAGWGVYAVVYLGFAVSTSLTALIAWFLIYGLYFGLTEGVEKALVADLAPADLRGTAFGFYNAALGVGQLLASLVFGLIWSAFGAAPAFGLGAALAGVATLLLFAAVKAPR